MQKILNSLIKAEGNFRGCSLHSDYLYMVGDNVVLLPLLDNRATAIKTARLWRDRIAKQSPGQSFNLIARYKGGQYKAKYNYEKENH